MSRPLIWGKVRLCRLNIRGDMTKSKNADFQKMSIYVMNMQQNGKWKKSVFQFLMISRVIFYLQRRTIPQIKGLDQSYLFCKVTGIRKQSKSKQISCPQTVWCTFLDHTLGTS